MWIIKNIASSLGAGRWKGRFRYYNIIIESRRERKEGGIIIKKK